MFGMIVEKVVYEFDPQKFLAVIATGTLVVQFIKKAAEWLKEKAGEDTRLGKLIARVAHGWGPNALNVIYQAAAVWMLYAPQLEGFGEDGQLTIAEVLVVLGWLGVNFTGSSLLYKSARKVAFTKE